jgi:hypothetical protein
VNIAFSALVIILLVVPGAIFTRTFLTGVEKAPAPDLGVAANLVPAAILSVPIHALTTLIFQWFTQQPVDHSSLIKLTTGFTNLGEDATAKLIQQASAALPWSLLYYLLAIVLAYITAVLLREFIRFLNLDLAWGWPPRQSYWYYVFNGQIQAIIAARQTKGIFKKIKEAFNNTNSTGVCC